LKELNPGYDGKEEHKIENGQVVELTIPGADLKDISPVRALAALQVLVCRGGPSSKGIPGILADLSPLKGLRLKHLDCYNTLVSDLSPLAEMPLDHLECAGCRLVTDLTPLQGLPLRRLSCFSTQVHDLRPLANAPLKELAVFRTAVSDLSPLKGVALDRLKCQSTKVTDLSPIKGAPLVEIDCDIDPKGGIEILRSIKTLKKVNGLPVAEFWKEVEAGKIPKTW
jgi:hypothetical protein